MYKNSEWSQYRVIKYIETLLEHFEDWDNPKVKNHKQLYESIWYLYDSLKENQWSRKTEWGE